MYFDKTENPYRYDNKYATEKIKKWKKEKMMDFFISLPIENLIPSLKQSEEDFNLISEMVSKIDQQHLQKIISILSSQGQKTGSSKALQSILKQAEAVKI